MTLDDTPMDPPFPGTPSSTSQDAEAAEKGGFAELPALLRTQTFFRLPAKARIGTPLLVALALVFALQWAKAFLIPLAFGLLFSYALAPVVGWLERIRIPRLLATAIVMMAVVGSLGIGFYSLHDQTKALIQELPGAVKKLSAAVDRVQDSPLGAMQKMKMTAQALREAAMQTEATPQAQAIAHVVIDEPPFKLTNFLWEGSRGVVGAASQLAMIIFLVFFLLMDGGTFRRRLVRMSISSPLNQKATVRILDRINASMQRYMAMMLVTNVLVGVLSWLAFQWLGLAHSGPWAVLAGALHVIPYLGPALTAIATGIAAFVQFDSLPRALLVAGASLGIAVLVGILIATRMAGEIAKMNSAAVFISLLFWGWLWGIWGVLLTVPLMVTITVISEHVNELQPVSELLGE